MIVFGGFDASYWADNPVKYDYGVNLPVAKHKLPKFDLWGRTRTGIDQERAEQSTDGTGIQLRVDQAVRAVFDRARSAPFTIPAASRMNFAPAILGMSGRNYRAEGTKTIAAMMLPTPAAASIFQSMGPGLTPPSPFVYGSRGGVAGAVPVGMRPLGPAVGARVSVRGNIPWRGILAGE